MTVDGLLSKLGGKLEEINFLEIQSYLRKSKACRNLSHIPPVYTYVRIQLARKITTYIQKAKAKEKGSWEQTAPLNIV